MTKSQELMPPPSSGLKKARKGFENEWHVVVDKNVFILNQDEAEVLHKATVGGGRGIVWFEDFAISIPHIQSIRRKPIRIYEQMG